MAKRWSKSAVEVWVPGVPIAQPRHLVRSRVARGGRFAPVHYLPNGHPVRAYKQQVRLAAAKKIAEPYDGPVRLVLEFVLPRPKAMVWKNKVMHRTWHCKKPDADNLAKAVMDALQSVAWNDDSQVSELLIAKVIAGGNEEPGVRVVIEPLE